MPEQAVVCAFAIAPFEELLKELLHSVAILEIADFDVLRIQMLFESGEAVEQRSAGDFARRLIGALQLTTLNAGVYPVLRGFESGPAADLRIDIHLLPLRMEAFAPQFRQPRKKCLHKLGDFFVTLV